MSKASNKRAKKLDQEAYVDALVTLDQKSKFAKQTDDDLFYIADGKTKPLTPAQLRRQELTDLLFTKPVDTAKKPHDPFAFKKELKKHSIAPKASAFRVARNKKQRKLFSKDNEVIQTELQELYNTGVIDKNLKVIDYEEEDAELDYEDDPNNSLFPKTMSFSRASTTEGNDEDMTDSDSDEELDDSDDEEIVSELDDDEAMDQKAQDVAEYSDPEFMADWIKYTGNLSKPIKSLRKHHKKRFEELKQLEVFQSKDFQRANFGNPTQLKVTARALANSYLTGRHLDFVDMDNFNEDRDIWDDQDVQSNAEGKKYKNKESSQVIEEGAEWLIPLTEGGIKNRRHKATSKHVTAKQLVVAPAGLSINPQKHDMSALITQYRRRVRGEKRAERKVNRALAGDIHVKHVPQPSKKEVDRMHRTIYRPVETKPFGRIKTRTERNAEKKKALNKYNHAMELRQKRFDASFKKIHLAFLAYRKHEKYLKEKLPKIRADIAEAKKDQPIKFGRNAYRAPKPELQTQDRVAESQGHLRRTFMSTNLLSDAFGALQRTNMIPAVGKRGKRAPKKQVILRHTRAPGSIQPRIDVDEVMVKAKQRAEANPKPVHATKNKKRKLEVIKGYNKEAVEDVDYGYDSDDDIWG